MHTVLVTGGCGYIGSHTCINLIESNYNVLIVDSLVNSSKNTFSKIKIILNKKGINIDNRITFLEGDLRNEKWLDNIFSEYYKSDNPIKSVIHFAGLKSINSSLKFPLEYWDINISSTISLLSIMKKYKCYSIIFSSSATVYKPNGTNLLKEDGLLEPKSPYGKTKLTIENILKDLFISENQKWRIANLRYFNPVGAHPSGMIGENLKGEVSNLFPSIIRTIKGNQKKLSVFGNDWPTKDGTCVRDFIHVIDLADAHIATLNFLQKNKEQYKCINIGTGIGTSVLEVIETFLKLNDGKFNYQFEGRRLGDEPFIVADNKIALELLEWKPKKNLIDMCVDSLNSLIN